MLKLIAVLQFSAGSFKSKFSIYNTEYSTTIMYSIIYPAYVCIHIIATLIIHVKVKHVNIAIMFINCDIGGHQYKSLFF